MIYNYKLDNFIEFVTTTYARGLIVTESRWGDNSTLDNSLLDKSSVD